MGQVSLLSSREWLLDKVLPFAHGIMGVFMPKIAFITEELAVYGKSGGIGAAVFELAVMLREKGYDIDIHYIPLVKPDAERQKFIVNAFIERGISLIFVEPSKYCHGESEATKRSYAIFRHMEDYGKSYDFLHIHDYKGLGYFCTTAKKQGLAFQSTTIIVQLHGPTRWTMHANRGLFFHPDQLLIDYLERKSIAQADHVVSPSLYLIDWMKKNDFELPALANVHIIKNIFSQCKKILGNSGYSDIKFHPNEIIFFGRHEQRKGLITFCDTIDILAKELEERDINVCFLGNLGEINGRPSGIFLTERAKNWNFRFDIQVGLDRMGAMMFMRSRQDSVIVVPSTEENSPYTVVEAIVAGRAIVTSVAGGAKELIDPEDHSNAIVEMEPNILAKHILRLIIGGAHSTKLAETAEDVEKKWLSFHENYRSLAKPTVAIKTKPKVVVGITHFERPRKVIGAIWSVMQQTYDNISLVVVDDGSRSAETIEALPRIEKLVVKYGGRFIRRENGYLGAARNTIAKESESDFLLFLDDDDLLFPEAIDRLITVALNTQADIVNCLNIFLDASSRDEYEIRPESFDGKVSYVPLGGPLSLAPISNNFGSATALIKRSFFEDLRGYTEIKRVGYEDYELYVRALQKGAHIEVIPKPLYLYEVGKPSMISNTSRVENKQRIIQSIDIKCNPQEWLDSIELIAGQEARSDERNYADWCVSLSPHKDILKEIIATNNTLDRHIAALGEYALKIGASRVSDAWNISLQAIAKSTNLSERRVKPLRISSIKHLKSANIPSYEVELVSELALLINLGKFNEAITVLSKTLSASCEIPETIIEFIHELAVHNEINAQVVQPLIGALRECFVDEKLALRLQGAVASLSITAGMLDNARLLLSEIDAIESDEYVEEHADLQQVFGVSASEQALQHYHQHGQREGRRGFKTLRRVAHDLSKRLGREVRPWQLRYELDRVLRPQNKRPLSFARIRK